MQTIHTPFFSVFTCLLVHVFYNSSTSEFDFIVQLKNNLKYEMYYQFGPAKFKSFHKN